MKPRLCHQPNRALTRVDLLTLVAIVAFLAVIWMPAFSMDTPDENRALRINCVNNLKQIGLSYRIWEGDHNNQYPMQVPVARGGAMELVDAGNIAACFQVMSNELWTPKILICPADTKRVTARSFSTGFDNSHISYFVGLDADETYPQRLLSGDDDIALNGTAVSPGVVEFSPSDSISWTGARHGVAGNIGYADGAVMEASTWDCNGRFDKATCQRIAS